MQRTAPASSQADDLTVAQTSAVRSPTAPAKLPAARNEVHHERQSYLYPADEADDAPPNGGVRAYLKVFGGFCVFFITLGVSSTFSSYQAYYESDLLRSYSSSTISWVGTTQVFLLSFVGLFSGAFYDQGHVRPVLAAGMALVVLGLMMLSLAHRYWQVLLTQGICMGFGSGLLYVPAVSVVSNQFTSKRAVALGMAATGSAVGGVVLPIMFRQLLPLIGFGWMNRVLGLLILILASVAFILLTDVRGLSQCLIHGRHRKSPRSREQHPVPSPQDHLSQGSNPRGRIAPLLTALSGRAYFFLCMGVFFVFLGYWVPLFYIVPFASNSLGTTPSYASYLLSILNAGSVFGRVLPACLDQIIGSAVVLFTGAVSLSAIVFAWLGIQDVPGITVWCFLVGFTSGIVVSIPNAVASRLSNPSNVGLRIGFMWTVGAFAELIGAPIAGALVRGKLEDGQGVNYLGGQIFGGTSIVVGAAFLVVPAWSIFKDDKMTAVSGRYA